MSVDAYLVAVGFLHPAVDVGQIDCVVGALGPPTDPHAVQAGQRHRGGYPAGDRDSCPAGSAVGSGGCSCLTTTSWRCPPWWRTAP